tara:strand:- start:4276 stop:4770 length:495 start_codon:yes stop_codon:yes gene_type:complete
MNKLLFIILFFFNTNILLAQTDCFNRYYRTVTCTVDSQTCINDTIISIIPENCNTPFLKDSIDGTWKLMKSNGQIIKIFTIENRKLNGLKFHFYKNKIIYSSEYKRGELKKSSSYYKNGQLYSLKKFKTIPNGSRVTKSTFWDKSGNKIDELKSYNIWDLEYCE